jgi:hypothetical protein
MNALFFGARGGGDPAPAGANTPREPDCPGIEIRSGAASYAVGAQAGDVTPTTLRYQADISRSARECTVRGGNMTIKVGIQGRVILGPAGGPGPIEVPMRVAVVREGTEPHTLWTKLYRVRVMMSPGQSSVPFVQIEEDMTFPMPSAADLAALVIYVGFDPNAAPEPERRKPRRKPA